MSIFLFACYFSIYFSIIKYILDIFDFEFNDIENLFIESFNN